jgi:hypothetical protein
MAFGAWIQRHPKAASDAAAAGLLYSASITAAAKGTRPAF